MGVWEAVREGAVTSTLDSVVDRETQLQWLKQEHPDICNDIRPDIAQDSAQRERYSGRYSKLCQHEQYENLLNIAAVYVRNCILLPRVTEKIFWNISCLPKDPERGLDCLCRFNMNRMETFVMMWTKKVPATIYSFLNIAASPIIERYGSIDGFKKKFSIYMCYKRPYAAAEDDQVTIEVAQLKDIVALLKMSAVANGAKRLNLRIMRKGKDVYAKSHCIQLSDDIVQRATLLSY